MNKARLKSYAPAARREFIQAVTDRAHFFGLSEKEIVPVEEKGDLAIIGGRPFPKIFAAQRKKLEERVRRDGFNHVMEAVAYTWFNRFAALRYMEIHDYLDHGHRVLSNRDGGMPEILNHATELDLPGFNKTKAVELKLAGNKDGELYKMLLVAQCNALSRAMPFLFERIDDETELLLPDNLLRTDSIVAKLVEAIPEEDWQEVEIIGWLYQFYISEKKDEVIGKVVKSEDIPAATQLFTPNWIVQYLVQNSLGRLWLMANPASTLKSQWPYYIEPAEQTPEVQAQLDALIQTRIQEDSHRQQAGEELGERAVGATLNPETLTVLDPACGSGHILVVAYDVLKAIYLERGYQLRTIPRLMLEKNLYGLDIDDRAAQLAGFALLMKARADDRRLFDNPPKLNVLALQESKGLDADEIVRVLLPSPAGGRGAGGEGTVKAQSIRQLIDTFAHAKTFGSLIQIPPELNAQLATLVEGLEHAIQNGDLYAKAAAQDLLPLVQQARVLGMQFDAVVANPPYMGNKGMSSDLKAFAGSAYPNGKSDLFSMFIERGFAWSMPSSFVSMVTMQSWMFLSSFEDMRGDLLKERTITSLLQIGYNSFPEMNSKIAQACAFSVLSSKAFRYLGRYVDLNSALQSADKNTIFLERKSDQVHDVVQDEFTKIPGSPIAYWTSTRVLGVFEKGAPLSEHSIAVKGLDTCDNDQFVRRWFEPSIHKVALHAKSTNETVDAPEKWYPYCKGGPFRRWAGNVEHVVNWENDGAVLRNLRDENGGIKSRPQSTQHYFRDGITFGAITSSDFACRAMHNSIFGGGGSAVFTEDLLFVLGFLNSKLVGKFTKILNPTLNMLVGDILKLPYFDQLKNSKPIQEVVASLVAAFNEDWDEFETALGFERISLISNQISVEKSWQAWEKKCANRITTAINLESKNNFNFIEAYGLEDELSPDVSESQITLARADREKDCQRLISYAIGCMMGRYSLDEPGLIYAHAGNVGFDATRYQTFPADADGIVPLTDELWFEDDAANRIREFLLAVWGAETLEENLAWLAESLGKKGNETPEETVRRYLSGNFYKDHLQTYKKRPIYWLFSSGKLKAFECLVYLHRYNETTLSRMRNEYVTPLMGKFSAQIEYLANEKEAASSTAERNKLQKQLDALKKKQAELSAFDDILRHYADQRISLDLDDGVKVNYGKFGNLLAEVKAIPGGEEA